MQGIRTFVLFAILVGVATAKVANVKSVKMAPVVKDSEDDPRCPVNCEYQPVGCECSVFYQCRDGVYSELRCPDGLHFNLASKQCDLPEDAGCNLDPKTCCECKYIGEACQADYVFQDYDRTVDEYEGDHHCIREQRSCDNGLVWNPDANGADGACDFTHNIPNCGNETSPAV